MLTRNLIFLINVWPLFVTITQFKCSLSMPRQRYRVYRSKGPPPFPPILSYSPPRLTSAQNFQADYAAPPFSMNGPPSSSYNQPSHMDYEPPNSIPMEYGPPTAKPVIHKHVYVHIPPPEPSEPVMRYFFLAESWVDLMWFSSNFYSIQGTSNNSRSAKTLSNRIYKSANRSSSHTSNNSFATTRRRKNTRLCSCKETRSDTRDCAAETSVDGTHQTWSLLYSLQNSGGTNLETDFTHFNKILIFPS